MRSVAPPDAKSGAGEEVGRDGALVRAMTSDSSPAGVACNNDLNFRSPQEAIGT